MIPLPKYGTVKDKFCLCYFGNCTDYLVQLRLLRPQMLKAFPDLQIWLGCKKEYGEHVIDPWISKENIKKEDFGYIRELTCDMVNHPVEVFMKQSGLDIQPVGLPTSGTSSYCIKPVGVLPSRSLTPVQVGKIESKMHGTRVDRWQDADIVIGTENLELFEAGAVGKRTILATNGIGKILYQKMYPKGDIWSV